MKTVSRSALLPYSAQQVFDIVNNVAAYQEFLPWCSRSDVLVESDELMEARLEVSKAGISQAFTTRNRLDPPHTIDLKLVEGPFSDFAGHWQFTQLGEDGCKIEMQLRFEFNGALLNLAFGKVFEQAADTLVDAFCERAREVYSRG